MFFFKKKGSQAARPVGVKTIYSGDYVHSKNFRGYKRIRLTTYGDDISLQGIRRLMSTNPSSDPFNVDGRTIQLDVVQDNGSFTEPRYYLNVYVDGMRVGAGYNCREEYITSIVSGCVDKVHVKIESDDDRFSSYLFIHIADLESQA